LAFNLYPEASYLLMPIRFWKKVSADVLAAVQNMNNIISYQILVLNSSGAALSSKSRFLCDYGK